MFISHLSCVLFSMFLASQTLANLLAIILNSLFFLSHAVSKRLCLPCPIFPLCPMLCIGKPQVGVKNFFLSTMSLSLVLQIQLLKHCFLLKGLPDTTIPPYPKGEMCYLFFLIFALLSFSEKKKKYYLVFIWLMWWVMPGPWTSDSRFSLLLWNLKMIHIQKQAVSKPRNLWPP